jgi:hypothetical protein
MLVPWFESEEAVRLGCREFLRSIGNIDAEKVWSKIFARAGGNVLVMEWFLASLRLYDGEGAAWNC